ncbi:MAG: hypothetical protein R3F48_01195 [Candidatus Zixiibacteriota bacterium]
MDIGSVVNLLVGLLNIILLFYNIFEKKKQNAYQVRLALFEKRLAVKDSIMSFISEVLISPSSKALDKTTPLLQATKDCEYLFGKEINEHVGILQRKALNLYSINSALENEPFGEKRDKIVDTEKEILTWFMDQFDKTKELFAPYLDLTKE